MFHACVADIVEKEFDDRQSLDEPGQLTTIPLKTEDVSGERSYDRDFNLVVDEQVDNDRFNSQRENFANLYISGPLRDNDDNGDVVYGSVHRRKQSTRDDLAVNDFNRFSGDK